VECCVLAELLQKKFPRLLSAFAAMDCHLHEITSTWFSHLFTMSLPATTAVRVWDCLLCEGPKVLFRVALALLKRQVLLNLSTSPLKDLDTHRYLTILSNFMRLLPSEYCLVTVFPFEMACILDTLQALRLWTLSRSISKAGHIFC
jgi:hypothetical protein